MRRVLQLSGLSGLLAMGFLSTHAFAEEPAETDTQPESATEETGNEAAAAEPTTAAPATVAPAAVVAAPAAMVSPPAPKPKVGDITAHGYFRAGFAANVNQKGRASCFGLYSINGNLKSKYRLGNECEQWGELLLSTVVYAGDDGTVGTFHFMPVVFIPTTYIGYSPSMTTSSQDQPDMSSTGATVAFPNLYADLKGIPWLFGGTAWAGSRYYKREAVYISDFFYWNPSGIGLGIEDAFQLGRINPNGPASLRDLSFSYGVFAVDGQPGGQLSPDTYLPQRYALGVRHDFQIRGFRPGEDHELQLGFQYLQNWSSDRNDSDEDARTSGGWGITARWIWRLLGGDNKLVLQYGVGGGTGFGTLARFYYPDFSLMQDASEWRARLVDVLTIQPLPWLGTQAAFVYQKDKNSTWTAGEWYSAGARVSIAFTEHAKVLGEFGYDMAQPDNDSERRWLAKATLALAIVSARGFWARPELRLFYTYATWNKVAQDAHIDTFDLYLIGNKLSAAIAGVQAEAIF